MTVGAYAAYVAQQSTHSIPVEVIAAVLTGGLLGFSINFFLLQPFVKRGARNLTLFVLTISVSIIVQSALQFVFTGANVAFTAEDRETVQQFHRAALAAGGQDNGPPGLRPHYHENYYGAFILDPDGHNIEAVCHRKQA